MEIITIHDPRKCNFAHLLLIDEGEPKSLDDAQ